MVNSYPKSRIYMSCFSFFYLAKNTYSIMRRKIKDVKDEEQKGLLRTERANLPGRGGNEYKIIFGIHVDVGRYRMKASMHI